MLSALVPHECRPTQFRRQGLEKATWSFAVWKPENDQNFQELAERLSAWQHRVSGRFLWLAFAGRSLFGNNFRLLDMGCNGDVLSREFH